MSGSRTAIMGLNGGNDTPVNAIMSNMAENIADKTSGAPKRIAKNSTPKGRTSTPLKFKLQLIMEVKKQDIIWQDIKEKKNPDLIDDAWQRVCRALRVKKEFCQKQWKLLIHGYRSHVNRKTPMHEDLIREMAFMSSQLKKSSSEEQSDSEAMDTESAPSKKQTPKPKKVNKTVKRASITEEDSNEDQKASVAILKLLFANVPADVMRPVRVSLVEVFTKLMPDVNTKISEHAKQQVKMGADINKIDWTALDIPVDICKAVWDHKVMQMVLKV